MAQRFDSSTGDIVLDGWERGIAPSPYGGCGALQCANIYTETGEIMCSYTRTMKTSKQISGGTMVASNGVANISYDYAGESKNPLTAGGWIHVTSGSGNIAAGYYYVFSADSSSPQNVQVASSYTSAAGNVITPNFSATLTFTTMDMGLPIHAAAQLRNPDVYNYYILDANGNIWCHIHDQTLDWVMLNNPNTQQLTNPNGLAFYAGLSGGYIFGFAGNNVEYFGVINDAANSFPGWTSWQNTNTTSSATYWHTAITGRQKDGVFFCDGHYLGSFAQVPGQTFDPTNSTTYTYNSGSTANAALLLPWDETSTCLAELNNSLLIGGVHNVLYQWDYGATTANEPSGATMIFTPENYTQRLLTVNNVVYIFSGSKGNIYVTNGSVVSPVITIPDYMAASPTGSVVEPYITWGGVAYLRGRIYFSAQATNCGGIWSFVPVQGVFIQQDTGLALRLEFQSSYGTYSGYTNVILAPSNTAGQNANGVQFWSGWFDGGSAYGIDGSGTTPYTGGQTIAESDMVTIGSYIDKGNFTSVQTRYGTGLVSGESVKIQYRTTNGGTWTDFADSTTGTDSAVGSVGARFPVPWANAIQVQLRAILTSTASSPSFVRFKEIRLTKEKG